MAELGACCNLPDGRAWLPNPRQCQDRLQAAALMIAQAKVPSVRLRDIPRNGKAQPCATGFAAARAFETVERFERLLDFCFRYARTVVAHVDRQPVRAIRDPN